MFPDQLQAQGSQADEMRRMCSCLQVPPSGYYVLKADPMSPRAQDDQRLLRLLKQESGGIYGYRTLTLDTP